MPYITKTIPYKTLKPFIFLKKIKNNGTMFSHGVYFTEKIKNGNKKSLWYVKFLNKNRVEALLETLAQEFLRLILPQQPKTRLVREPGNEAAIIQSDEYYILSKEIPFFNDTFFLCPKNYERILDGSYKGLAAAQVLALFLNEVDFKSGNVGVDKYGHVIKIDGGLSFIQLNRRFENLYKGKILILRQKILKHCLI